MSRSLRTTSRRLSSSRGTRSPLGDQLFTCVHCHMPIAWAPQIAGVQNRNHCPCCLWSRHMDWRTAGDRLSACRSPMEPVGLTTKHSRNAYAQERDGELMLIHRCTGCGKLVINRVAADDNAEAILALFERSHTFAAALAPTLDTDGVAILTIADDDLVRKRLFGPSHTSIATPEPLLR